MNNFFEKLNGQPIEDLYQVGSIEVEEGIGEMIIFHNLLFISFESVLLRFESIEQYSKLKISYADTIKFDFEIDEDTIYGKSSISEIILRDTMANNNDISCINVFNGKIIDDCLICDALSIFLKNNQKIFFDPTYVFGINIGGQEQENSWVDNLDKGKIIDSKLIILD